MDNKKRRTLAAVLAAAMVAATASVPAFATEDGNVPQTSVLGGGQVIVPSVKSARETTASPTITIGEDSYATLEQAANSDKTSLEPVTINITGSGVINLASAISFSKPVNSSEEIVKVINTGNAL